jgi:hypothetical protein
VRAIFQPEVAAEAIVWASQQRRRELYVGWPTVRAIVAEKITPGVPTRKPIGLPIRTFRAGKS